VSQLRCSLRTLPLVLKADSDATVVTRIADALAGAAAVAGATPPALMAFGGQSKTEAASL
jgi:hypothetical protein